MSVRSSHSVRKILRTCGMLALVLFLMTGCSGFKMSFTTTGNNTTIEVKSADDGYTAESPDFSVGSGRAAVITSSLEEGKLKIDFMQVTIFHNEDNSPDDVIYGDIAETITIGPGDKQTIALPASDYIMQVTVVGKTSGKVTVNIEKQ